MGRGIGKVGVVERLEWWKGRECEIVGGLEDWKGKGREGGRGGNRYEFGIMRGLKTILKVE